SFDFDKENRKIELKLICWKKKGHACRTWELAKRRCPAGETGNMLKLDLRAIDWHMGTIVATTYDIQRALSRPEK
ncbi:hypothetical protein HAX54_022178, partial [Datura stramonium]|nr:hypothetical protein [Datura stramonium]